ncbi:MAG: lipopolysaccharide heptosyltransferase 1 [Neptuniibacter caesariensis]|uniref:Lipopolysaccharide heptosyltransferase 1 n=1 Tax=Neptuniibacter caesariensis TaxID=207954 RepID=A0A2G6JB22_NEPCE|nr:MAG: lipopolysaccharide heptosyltransferase 1 [Neptuniibacter caesariensis]
MQVLVVKTSSLGDVIHTLPALTDAMHALPGIRFDWVVEEGFREIPGWHPSVDQVIPVAIRRWRKSLFSSQTRQEWQHYKAVLQANNYDAIIDAQGLIKSALLVTRLAKGPKYGQDKHSAREPLAARFFNHPLSIPKQQHAVERTRQLFAKALQYPLPKNRGDFALQGHFSRVSTPSEPYLVFQHSTTRFDKHWPEQYWESLIQMAGDAGWHIKLPWGNANEQARARRLASAHANAEVLPRLTLTEVAQILAAASGCVSVDTGLSHLAAALDRPNVILFGPTDPGLVGGYGKDQVCLKASHYPESGNTVEPSIFASLTPEIVFSKLGQLLV